MKLFYQAVVTGVGALSLFFGTISFADHRGDFDDDVVIVDLDGNEPVHGGGGHGHGGGGHRPGHGGGHRPGHGGGGGPIILPVERDVIHCASGQYRYNECYVRGDVLNVRLVRQMSAARCDEGRTFGATSSGVWVDRGCRGNFEVYYRARHRWEDAVDISEE